MSDTKNVKRWNQASVVEEAARLVDQVGFEALTLSALAQSLKIQPPSLYKHIVGLDDLRTRLKVHAIRKLHGILSRAAIGKAGDAALNSVAVAYRKFTLSHPGLQAAISYVSGSETANPIKDEANKAADELVEFGAELLSGYEVDRLMIVHALRTLRSLVHGFALLESGGGFQIKVSTDESFQWAIDALIQQLHRNRKSRTSTT